MKKLLLYFLILTSMCGCALPRKTQTSETMLAVRSGSSAEVQVQQRDSVVEREACVETVGVDSAIERIVVERRVYSHHGASWRAAARDEQSSSDRVASARDTISVDGRDFVSVHRRGGGLGQGIGLYLGVGLGIALMLVWRKLQQRILGKK